MKPKIEFINHASVLISNEDISLLSDPWYQGDAFHKGWNLIRELSDHEIEDLIERVTHIWISHEHPDHFSISFFKKFKSNILKRNIKILFQKTDDRRVESFLRGNNFDLIILDPNKWVQLGNDYKILNFKDGFYDSGLSIKTCNMNILNLNDCEIKTNERCNEVHKVVGDCDVLISQFSYAAWKGGESNIKWRKNAAIEKLETLQMQVDRFNPKFLIPFASFVYFSNYKNFYLNDSSNKPDDVINKFETNKNLFVKVMKPFDVFDFKDDYDNNLALEFWKNEYSKLTPKNKFTKVDFDELNDAFLLYKDRLFKNNSKLLIRIARLFSPVSVFKPLNIFLEDVNLNITFDIFAESLIISNSQSDVEMSSESFSFIMKNTFGFDTLTVNGCFEEKTPNGFSKMTKSMAIENLNNLGIKFNFLIIFNFKLIIMFLKRLIGVNRKINLTG